ncbi:ribosome maturation factor RimM [Pediococcus damnosus LMG 28219]|uniref:ribosome maturation factor RimM n=1 Tax=Pediococcus damnosus TaxID=51663 RepID=UPI00061FD27D|nr:ribosome maturation factor RimM [Pediococcus damnosus]AMV61484.1 16S rRNA processing protein RimM [Pediococcus damnosus]AMV65846.1 16S rRNA processing protein RimM [Pediococcus damnosus]AMV70184.1 16S rRNA processing protein RimM [Pediococcus damnosus]KJU75208.1 ribosome maturation factor RimM [Pediococcus damnosus LMG 28219]PIO81853.1 ribosome maturation factor RimM [Pediococcus damnosus]
MQYYNVGKIVNTHGIQGEVKVMPITDFPKKRFQVGKQLYLFAPKNENKPVKALKIAKARQQKSLYFLKFDGFNSINDVEKFKQFDLKISAEDRGQLSSDEFYYDDIIGLDVYDLDEQLLGQISEILSLGANDVWVVKRSGKKDLLLPYIQQVIKKVDLNAHRVTVELLEGLDE